MDFTFDAVLWRWQARRDSWFFVSLPEAESAEVSAIPLPPRGFGAVRVRVRIGGSSWESSVFPGADGRYVLPVRRAVREREGLEEGDSCPVTLEIVI